MWTSQIRVTAASLALAGAAVLLPSAGVAQEYGAEFTRIEEQGCSQSWAQNEMIVQVQLNIESDEASLQLDVSTRSRSGSRGDPSAGVPWYTRDVIECSWAGVASVDAEGQLSISFSAPTIVPEDDAWPCRVGASDGSFDVVCTTDSVAERTTLIADGTVVPPSNGNDPMVEVLRCENRDNLPEAMHDAAHAERTDASAPRVFYLAESGTVQTTVQAMRGYVYERVVTVTDAQ